jgi:hypothetical protein
MRVGIEHFRIDRFARAGVDDPFRVLRGDPAQVDESDFVDRQGARGRGDELARA